MLAAVAATHAAEPQRRAVRWKKVCLASDAGCLVPLIAVDAASLGLPRGQLVAGPRAWSQAPVRGEPAGPEPGWLCSDRPESFCQWQGRTALKRVRPGLGAVVHLRAEHRRSPFVICRCTECDPRRMHPVGAPASRHLGPWPVMLEGPTSGRWGGPCQRRELTGPSLRLGLRYMTLLAGPSPQAPEWRVWHRCAAGPPDRCQRGCALRPAAPLAKRPVCAPAARG